MPGLPTKAKTDKWDHSKEATRQNEKTACGVEKRSEIFVNHIVDKGLIYKIYKKPIYLKSKITPTNNLMTKWAKPLNRHFSRRTYRWPADT